ncbi:MAG: O-antigen ligase family protein [Ectothiorhodospiraceae bacterium]|nr:O-antigen ligase family protein [Ectothiorhodospiraceae bacterium]
MNALVERLPLALPKLPEGRLGYWAIGCIYVFAFIPPRSIALGQLSQLVMLIVAILFAVRYRDVIFRTPLFWLGAAFVLYVLLRGLFAAFVGQPELASEHLDGTSSWARTIALPVLILGLALVATGNWVRHSIGALIALALGILVFQVLPAWSWSEFETALTGARRYIFGLGHARSGFIIGAAIIAVLALGPAMVGKYPRGGGVAKRALAVLRYALWACLVGALLLALFVTKTRTAWLAVLAAVLVLVLAAAWFYRDRLLRPGTLVGLLLAAVVVGGVAVFAWDEVERRMTDRTDAMQQILAMDSLDDAWVMEDRNLGARMAYKVFAIQLWMERPLIGWGPADPYYLMRERPLPPVLEGRSGHFHDAHVETLSRLGLVGWGLMMAFLGALVLEACRRLAMREEEQRLPRMLALTTIGFTALLLVWMLGTHQLVRFQTVHVFAPFLALMCASVFQRRLDAVRRGG